MCNDTAIPCRPARPTRGPLPSHAVPRNVVSRAFPLSTPPSPLAGTLVVSVAGVSSSPTGPLAWFVYTTLAQPPTLSVVTPLQGPLAGGTLVTVAGRQFSCTTTRVMFVARGALGLAGNSAQSGARRRSVAAMVCSVIDAGCSTSVLQCLSPPNWGTDRSFDVQVVAAGVTLTFRNPWVYDAPEVTSVAPEVLAPYPAPSSPHLVVRGLNFGTSPGEVTVGGRAVSCSSWSDTVLECNPPSGVSVKAVVGVRAASGAVSQSSTGSPSVQYLRPVVTAVSVLESEAGGQAAGAVSGVVGTQGGAVLVVRGVYFGCPLPTSVWLVRHGAGPTPPWDSHNSSSVQQCASTAQCMSSVTVNQSSLSSLTCTVPPGAGVGWRVVVVNHDAPGTVGSSEAALWRASEASAFTLAYRAPTIVQVAPTESVGGGRGAASAVGGFALMVLGTDFGLVPPPTVLVGTLPCVVLPGTVTQEGLCCVAPPRQVDGNTTVVVVQDGQSAQVWTAFAYDPPVLLAVAPSAIDAVALDGTTRLLTLHGVNFGSLYRPDVVGNHVVQVDGQPCRPVVWRDDATVQCTFDSELVAGQHNVSLRLAADTTQPVPIVALCPATTYGAPGQRCSACPEGAVCMGKGADPVSLPGYYPQARERFVPCSPPAACVGGADSSVLATSSGSDTKGCARNYAGLRCAVCRVGSYVCSVPCTLRCAAPLLSAVAQSQSERPAQIRLLRSGRFRLISEVLVGA